MRTRVSFLRSGPRNLFSRLDRTRGVRVVRQLITMGMGVRCMFFRKHGFFQGLMSRVREGMVKGVMTRILKVATAILAGSCLDRCWYSRLLFGNRFSGGHNH